MQVIRAKIPHGDVVQGASEERSESYKNTANEHQSSQRSNTYQESPEFLALPESRVIR